MAVCLDEEMCSRAPDTIGFLHLVSCNGVVAITAAMMFGVHSSQFDHFGKLYAGFWKFCTARECGSLNTNDFRKSTGAKDSIVGKKSMLHTGKFHGVDYGTRLVECAV